MLSHDLIIVIVAIGNGGIALELVQRGLLASVVEIKGHAEKSVG